MDIKITHHASPIPHVRATDERGRYMSVPAGWIVSDVTKAINAIRADWGGCPLVNSMAKTGWQESAELRNQLAKAEINARQWEQTCKNVEKNLGAELEAAKKQRIETFGTLSAERNRAQDRCSVVEKELEATKRELQAMSVRLAEAETKLLDRETKPTKRETIVKAGETIYAFPDGCLPCEECTSRNVRVNEVGDWRCAECGTLTKMVAAQMKTGEAPPFTFDAGQAFPTGAIFKVFEKPPAAPSVRDRIISAASKRLDERFMGPGYRDTVAQAIADGICAAMGLPYPQRNEDEGQREPKDSDHG